jgi:hypothetical protein
MIEYISGAIKANAGENITITAEITNESGEEITEDCQLHIFDNNKTMLLESNGTYQDGEWSFLIPAEATKELSGRYFYCIGHKGTSLCFKQPIYFV